ncbi:MAG: hypothetical protein DHS20C18_53070 [Saprospiraceae bacterium]|nr:MAG: hypothetical protein DHS20C18_53070 [Saprospiraceae bacterium]
MIKNGSLILLLSLLYACHDPDPQEIQLSPEHFPPASTYEETDYQDTTLLAEVLYDKLLGLLVGSAIGDAMAAPTEMWWRETITDEYNYVDSLDLVLREPSPEGPWDFNQPPGAGTDDTRWKALTIHFLEASQKARPQKQAPVLTARHFADYIASSYEREIDTLKATAGVEPEPFEAAMRQLTWLQEWARVARAYQSGDIDAYRNTVDRFYGGEMACAGLLYAPTIGAFYPGRPKAAYQQMHDLSIFDLGYARDLSSLTAALTAAALHPDFKPDSLLKIYREIDQAGYFRSRLLGRIAYQQLGQARSMVRKAKRMLLEDFEDQAYRFPPDYPYDSLYYARTQYVYEELSELKQSVPFHAGEIHLIHLTALLFCDFDFKKSMEFITNYGRDNDTVAAVTGAVLGAYHGFGKLPVEQRDLVVRVNREVLDIDLEVLARSLTELILARR